jgi:hypothetical protein
MESKTHHTPVPAKVNAARPPVVEVCIAVPFLISDNEVSLEFATGDQSGVYAMSGEGASTVRFTSMAALFTIGCPRDRY